MPLSGTTFFFCTASQVKKYFFTIINGILYLLREPISSLCNPFWHTHSIQLPCFSNKRSTLCSSIDNNYHPSSFFVLLLPGKSLQLLPSRCHVEYRYSSHLWKPFISFYKILEENCLPSFFSEKDFKRSTKKVQKGTSKTKNIYGNILLYISCSSQKLQPLFCYEEPYFLKSRGHSLHVQLW